MKIHMLAQYFEDLLKSVGKELIIILHFNNIKPHFKLDFDSLEYFEGLIESQD